MSKSKNIDSFQAMKQHGLIASEESRVVTEVFVWILGEKFEVEDLLDLLYSLETYASQYYITCPRSLAMLKNLGIVSSSSPSWGTRIENAERLRELREDLSEAVKTFRKQKGKP
jgi:hypothetical protein